MEKSNQLPKTEGCSAEGESVDLWFYWLERPSRSVSRGKREPQAGAASRLSNSSSKGSGATGGGGKVPEANTRRPEKRQGVEGLPGSEKRARVQTSETNPAGPA